MESPLAFVIPAGGGGTRLWPRSRQHTPKQFLDIITPGRTMVQETVDRVTPELVEPGKVYVITNARHVSLVRKQLPDVPHGNVIGEPVGRDSAAAIGLMAALLEKELGENAIMAVLPADHVILDPSAFRKAIQIAVKSAEDGYLVTLGIPPTSPDTGFGYIQRGEQIQMTDPPVYDVREFKEKPSKKIAEQYLATGTYFWNAGMYIATVKTFRSLFQEFLPEMEEQFQTLVAAIGSTDQDKTFQQIFPHIKKISIDYGIVEKASKVAVVPAQIGWNDVGSWTRVAEVLAHTADENGVVSGGHHIGVDTTNSLIYSEKLVTTIGVDGLIIIDTPDGLLIANKSRSEDVKLIVEQLKAEGKEKFL
jgi:mannose-1-phosphate guanylyltransferase